jgi:Flp pilus assembly pilin Flp
MLSARRLARDDAGASAVEFAMAAPFLIAGMILMVDYGIAMGTQMELGRNVRAGAQAAMSLNNDAEAIEGIVLASSTEPQGMDVAVEMVCFCEEAVASCGSPCGFGTAPAVFVEIGAERSYSGLVLQNMALRAQTRVQIR